MEKENGLKKEISFRMHAYILIGAIAPDGRTVTEENAEEIFMKCLDGVGNDLIQYQIYETEVQEY